jgi:hypothetical protein
MLTVRVKWPKKPNAVFDIARIRLGSRSMAYGAKLRIKKTRSSTSVSVRVTKLKPGKLRFAVRAVRVTAPTTATVKIRRS